MTIEANIAGAETPPLKLSDESRFPIAGETIIDGVKSELVVLGSNSARIEHYRETSDHRYLCGRDPVLHKGDITSAGIEVLLAVGSAEPVIGKVSWRRDPIAGGLREAISKIRRELDSIAHS